MANINVWKTDDPIHDELSDSGADEDRQEYEDMWDRMEESPNGPIAP